MALFGGSCELDCEIYDGRPGLFFIIMFIFNNRKMIPVQTLLQTLGTQQHPIPQTHHVPNSHGLCNHSYQTVVVLTAQQQVSYILIVYVHHI